MGDKFNPTFAGVLVAVMVILFIVLTNWHSIKSKQRSIVVRICEVERGCKTYTVEFNNLTNIDSDSLSIIGERIIKEIKP